MRIKTLIGGFISDRTKVKIKVLRAAMSFVRAGGTISERECNICHYRGLFYPAGDNLRRDATCLKCGSVERHRLLKLWFDQKASELKEKSVLHFAPESSITKFIKPVVKEYVTADLLRADVDQNLNIEDIGIRSHFDVVIASHVLEHVDDKKALASISRALKPSGMFLCMIPIVENMETYENLTIVSPKDRELYFGQFDHVRVFGRDFDDRARTAGFSVQRYTPIEPAISRFSLFRGETLFICRK